MRYNALISLISKHLADEIVSETEMLSYMDRVIDDINTRLNTTFPTFTEHKEHHGNVPNNILDYTAIPDKYLRTVVVPGAAFKYYTTDEEGSYASPKYEEDYRNGLFYMERDFSFSIPRHFRADHQGYIDIDGTDEGLVIPPNRIGGLF